MTRRGCAAGSLSSTGKLRSTGETLADLVITDGTFDIEGTHAVAVLPTHGESTRLARNLAADPFSPLMEGFDPRGLVWYAVPIQRVSDARVLLASGRTPLIWQRQQTIFLNVDPRRSNFFCHASFPVFVDNLGRQLERLVGGVPRRNYRQGERLIFSRHDNCSEPLEITLPSGRVARFEPEISEIDLGRLTRSGLYRVQCGASDEQFAVSFLDAREGDLSTRGKADEPPAIRTTAGTGQRASDPMPPILMLTACACLIAAWLLLRTRGTPA
ncbi:MAG: hypothetical protein V3T05_10955 [Myxococcota bacterium]